MNSSVFFSFRLLFVMLIMAVSISSPAQSTISFERINSDKGLPCDETNCVTQDKEGFIWIGALYGLYKYDGYQIRIINGLSGKNIKNIKDSGKNYLWIGTNDGLYKLDKQDGKLHRYQMLNYDNCNVINRVYIDSRDSVWVGTNGGLYSYDQSKDSMLFRYNLNKRSLVPHCSVTDICEDGKGYLWIGTWDRGLFRYNMKTGKWYEMPKFNDANSAQKICIDSSGHLWIGTWNYGLYEILNPYDTDHPLQFNTYINHFDKRSDNEINGNYIYTICDNKSDGCLWIGTNNGLSICTKQDDGTLTFDNYPKANDHATAFLGTGVESLFADHNGRMWMCTTQYGVVSARKQHTLFHTYSYQSLIGSTSENITNCLSTSPDGSVYIGLKNIGFAHISNIKDDIHASISTHSLTGLQQIYKGTCLTVLSDGRIATGTESDGFFICHKDGFLEKFEKGNPEWLDDRCVKCFFEEDDGTLLVGNWKGLAVLYPDGTGRNISKESGDSEFIKSQINKIVKVGVDEYWMASSNNGILHIKGHLSNKRLNARSIKIKYYKEVSSVSRVLYSQSNEVWACSPSGGLLKYDKSNDRFINMAKSLSFPAQIVRDMEEDRDGNIWLTTNLGIIRMSQNPTRLRIFTKSDGLPTNYLGRSLISMMPDGDLCVSMTDYITFFSPSEATDKSISHPAHITQLKVFNEDITSSNASEITLGHDENDLTIEFSTLSYDDIESTRYSYMLEGYDHDWIYPSIGRYSAYYSNLPSGSYTFRLRSADASGVWTDSPETLTISVLPPLYHRWWAILGYILATIAVVYLILRYFQRKREQKEEVKLAKLQAEQVEELNHKKLQFFTNISHDLMTPLTIISAITESTDAMAMPQKPVMQNNVNKLIRMLQQILEFRKVESGNLSLRVSERDIVAFCRNEVESITPLMHSKGIDIEFYSNEGLYKCWFDVDALDKIIYNLLANAAKYSKSDGGKVRLMLNCGPTTKISITDNGPGIPESMQKDLFKRFYEGEHRKFNTYGTGIGLSLARDLTTLHHGKIEVESKEGQGTTFLVSIPVTRPSYSDIESDGGTTVTNPEIIQKPETTDAPTDTNTSSQKTNKTILLVEDNEELRDIVSDILSSHYNIKVADNGKDALEVMRSPDTAIDMVLTDVMMPEMDGMELTRIIKSDIETSHIPVLLLTAKRTDEDRTEAYRMGADGYITKPFSMELLLARVENLLRQRKQTIEKIVTSLTNSDNQDSKDIESEKEHLDITPLDTEFIHRCKECVMKHIDDSEFDQQQFADEMNVSKSTLYKKLRAFTNMNTPQFIRSIRMSMALKILKENPLIRISELAYSVGFNDPKYFSQCFKADFGKLPSDYYK